MNTGLVLLVILIVLLLVGLPTTGLHNWGWYPSGGIGLVILVLIVLLLLGRI
jgi:hypothetical protein